MKGTNVFLATLPRSGSTLLGMLLGAHSQIAHVGESAYWSKMNVYTSRCCCGLVGCQKLIDMVNLMSPYASQVTAIKDACGAIDFQEEPNKIRHGMSHSEFISDQVSFSNVIKSCCDGLGKVADAARIVFGKHIIVENSKYLSIAETLLKRDESWKIIIVTRDPRGVAFSSEEAGRRKNVPRPIEDKIELFLSFAKRVAVLAKDPRVLVVRYEDVCRDTAKALGHVCDFLDIGYEPTMTQFKVLKGHVLMANRMMYDSNQHICEDLRWRTSLSPASRSLFLRRDLVETYNQIGYNLMVEP